MLYSVLIGQDNYSYNCHPQIWRNTLISYVTRTISMSSANTQDCVLTNPSVLDANRKLFGFQDLNFVAKFNHINMHINVTCGFVPNTNYVSEYKLFRKPGTDFVFGAIFNNGAAEYPTAIPAEWQDYVKDQYMIDYIMIDFADLRFSQTDNNNNAVVINFGCNSGPNTRTLRVGYKHENSIASGAYLIDIFVGEQIESVDYGVHYAAVYVAGVNADDQYTYQIPTVQPYQFVYHGDGSFASSFKTSIDSINDDIQELQDIVGPLTDRIGSLRSQYTTR